MKRKEKSVNQSVDKLMRLLAYLSNALSPVRLADIAKDTGIAQATVLRYLNGLVEEGFVYQDLDTRRYALTWKLFELGEKSHNNNNLRTISNDLVLSLYEKLRLGICLVIEMDQECVYLDCLYEPKLMGRTLMRIGKHTPLHAASSGKTILTQYSEKEIDDLIKTKGLAKLTPHTITTKDALLKELEKIRQQGFAVDDEEVEEGLKCVAQPVYDYSGKIYAAISVFGSARLFDDAFIQNVILPPLRKTAQNISYRLGYDVKTARKNFAKE
jgi:IclR family KDG regulon transcriptional repressor